MHCIQFKTYNKWGFVEEDSSAENMAGLDLKESKEDFFWFGQAK